MSKKLNLFPGIAGSRNLALCAVTAGVMALGWAGSAQADEFYHRHPFRYGLDVRLFAPRELDQWRGGYWHHGWHEGRFGWWWFAGGIWYFYDQPIYPYPSVVSSVTVVEPAPQPQVQASPAAPTDGAPTYYYCDNPAGYYPYVQTCSVPFRPVPAQPPQAGPPPGPPAPVTMAPLTAPPQMTPPSPPSGPPQPTTLTPPMALPPPPATQ